MRAYFTLVNDEEFVTGARVLASSLNRMGSGYPLVAVVSELSPGSLESLRAAGIEVVEHRTLAIETPHRVNGQKRRSRTFSKLHVWDLLEFEQGVFLDADTIVAENIDSLFERKEFAAVGTPAYFNTGVFVFEPSSATYRDLLELAEVSASDPTYEDDSEELLLQRYFRDRFSPLPPEYNVRVSLNASMTSLPNITKPRVFHFEGRPKPWELQPFDATKATMPDAMDLWKETCQGIDPP